MQAYVRMGGKRVIAKSVVGHKYVHMGDKSLGVASAVGHKYVHMGGISIHAKSAVVQVDRRDICGISDLMDAVRNRFHSLEVHAGLLELQCF